MNLKVAVVTGLSMFSATAILGGVAVASAQPTTVTPTYTGAAVESVGERVAAHKIVVRQPDAKLIKVATKKALKLCKPITDDVTWENCLVQSFEASTGWPLKDTQYSVSSNADTFTVTIR